MFTKFFVAEGSYAPVGGSRVVCTEQRPSARGLRSELRPASEAGESSQASVFAPSFMDMEGEALHRARLASDPRAFQSAGDTLTPDDHVHELEIAHEEGCCECCRAEDGRPVLDYLGLARAYSMELRNDPRFFTTNILMTRLLAFSGLATLSSIFLSFSMAEAFGSSKKMPFTNRAGTHPDEDGVSDLIATFLNMAIFYSNIVTTYVAVAQPYHVYRLMTAGPNGQDMATEYYLNANITTWRHFAVKGMMLTMPVYILARGISLMQEFDRANYNAASSAAAPTKEPHDASVEGYFFAIEGIVASLMMTYMHCMHNNIFREHYENKICLAEDFLTTNHILAHGRLGSTYMDV